VINIKDCDVDVDDNIVIRWSHYCCSSKLIVN